LVLDRSCSDIHRIRSFTEFGQTSTIGPVLPE